MLDAPLPHHAHWLPLQPLSSTTPDNSFHASASLNSALPGTSCSIEALRDTFAPLSYTPPHQRRPNTASAAAPSISLATTRDLPAILNLHEQTLPISYSPAFFLSLLLNSGYTILVARSPSSPPLPTGSGSGKAVQPSATVVACATAFLDAQRGQLELLTLCVDAKYARRGVATDLLHSLATTSISSLCPPTWSHRTTSSSSSSSSSCHTDHLTATLRVQTTNTAGIALYTKLGFLIDGIEPAYYRGATFGGTAAYRMKKILSS